MPFEPLTKSFSVNYSQDLQAEVTSVVVNLPAGNNTISRVISIVNKACVDTINLNSGSAQIEGKIHSDVLIQAVDGGFANLEATTTYSVSIINKGVSPELSLLASARVIGISSVQASENMVGFTVNVSTMPILITSRSTQILESAGSIAEQKHDMINYVDIISATAQEFDLSVELDLPASISNVLSITATTALKNVEAGNDLVALQGEICCNMIYLTADDEPKLKNHHYSQEFTHEILANGVTISDFVNAALENMDTKYELTGEINSAKGTVVLNNKLKANIIIGQAKSIEVVADAFCPRYVLEPEFADFEQQFASNMCAVEKIDGSINLGEESKRIDRVLCVGEGNIVMDNVVSRDGSFGVVGRLICDVVYKLDDDEGNVESVLAEIPFELNIRNESVTENSVLRVDIRLREVEARNKRAKEIDVLAELNVYATIINNHTDKVLRSLTLGARRSQNDAALAYYIIPSAETLWDASKLLLVPGELIMQQNPELQFPILSPQKVIIYRQKVLE